MASPPSQSAKESTSSTPLALPKRPTLALPGQSSRKPSNSSSSTPSHPLRQTSFPPQEPSSPQTSSTRHYAVFSPSESLDDVSDGEINSVISASIGDDSASKKRKRGEKRTRGKNLKSGGGRGGNSVSVNGDERRTPGRRTGITPSHIAAGDDAEAEDEDEDEEDDNGPSGGRLPLYDGGQMTVDEVNEERERKRAFYDSVPEIHRDRSEAYYRAKLRTADVRRLINQTLSQSVPQNVVLVVASYTKLFAGMLIEEARAVQAEWLSTEASLLPSVISSEVEVLQISQEERDNISASVLMGSNKAPNQKQPQNKASIAEDDDLAVKASPAPGVLDGLIQSIAECDRGPLLPDHLRVALHHYKKSRKGGPVGFTGLSLEGREIAAPRMGGRKLFR